MKIQDYVNEGINVVDSMRGLRKTTYSDSYISIVFPNGYVASIYKDENKYSVATCDYEGYFNWNILKEFNNGNHGAVSCCTEEEVCNILEFIKGLGGR